mmetsp:Transcript_28884/g.62785  ORF Transcript_28884/g.62785 Transcript_28884/m.62785 type:complete len:223 (+) Transcript_28884:1970-2638(+)
MCFRGTPRTAGAPRPFNGTSYSTASSSSSMGACVTTTSAGASAGASCASACSACSAWASASSAVDSLTSFTSSVAVVLCGVPSVFSPSFLSNFSSFLVSSAFSAFSFSAFSAFSGSGASTSNVSKLCEKFRRLISRFVKVTAKGQVSMTSAAAFSTPDSAIFSNLSSFSCWAMALSASVGFVGFGTCSTGGSSGTSRVEISAEATSQSDTACSTCPATGVTR